MLFHILKAQVIALAELPAAYSADISAVVSGDFFTAVLRQSFCPDKAGKRSPVAEVPCGNAVQKALYSFFIGNSSRSFLYFSDKCVVLHRLNSRKHALFGAVGFFLG